MKGLIQLLIRNQSLGPPEWCSGLRYCTAVLRRHYSLGIDPRYNWPSVVRVRVGFGQGGFTWLVTL